VRAIRPRVPLVQLGERFFPGAVDHIAIDNVSAARTAVEHPLESGRRLALLGAQTALFAETARLRLRGYKEALNQAGLPIAEESIIPTQAWDQASGTAGMQDLLHQQQPMPDAIFCANDLLAIGALRTLADHAIDV
jgi:LacI family transcriptional regulator, repressor for deo operon, udp, cdd, tsx, nupC, and nupG